MHVDSNRAVRCLLAASEVIGFAKTGGLADVAGSLPRALARRGIAARVVMPLYRSARFAPVPIEPTDYIFDVEIGQKTYDGRVCKSVLPGTDLPVYLIEQPHFFERDDPGL